MPDSDGSSSEATPPPLPPAQPQPSRQPWARRPQPGSSAEARPAAVAAAATNAHGPPASSSSASGRPRRPSDDEPLKQLWHLLNMEHAHRSGEFSLGVRARIVQLLYDSMGILNNPWLYFSRDLPLPEEWAYVDIDGVECNWSLGRQQRASKKLAGKEPERPRGKRCGKIMPRYAKTYSCKTCQANPLSVLCSECFHAADHEGHEILFGTAVSFTTVCDCGADDIWLPGCQICAIHPPLAPDEQPDEHPITWITDDPAISRHALKKVFDTISLCLEFIINSFCHSPLPNESGHLPTNLEDMREHMMHTAEPPENRRSGPWSVIISSSERHTLYEVTRQIMDATGYNFAVAEAHSRQLEHTGRSTVLVTRNPQRAYHAASMFSMIDIPVTLRLASDTFKEELAAVCVSWIEQMCHSEIGGDSGVFRRLLMRAMLDPRIPHMSDIAVADGTPLAMDLLDLGWGQAFPLPGQQVCRLDWLFYLDVRLWRRTRLDFRRIYTSLFNVGVEARDELACRLAINYSRLYEYFMWYDRDADTFLIHHLASHVMPSRDPSVFAANHAQLFNIVCDSAYAWFTGQIENDRLRVPAWRPEDPIAETEYVPVRIDGDRSMSFKGKKTSVVLQHIRLMLRNPAMQQAVVHSPAMTDRFITLANIFVGMQTQARELGSHVEYEVDWPRTFNVLTELSKNCREFAAAFKHATSDEMLSVLSTVATRIICDQTLVTRVLDPDKYLPLRWHYVNDVLVPGHSAMLIENHVATIRAFSFHTYLHFIFGELLRWAPPIIEMKDSEGNTMSFGDFMDALIFRIDFGDAVAQKLTLLEVPITKFAVFAQVKADMWKKNGSAFRNQMIHYRDYAIRDCTVDQDFLVLQFGLCNMDPLIFITALIDRYGLSNFFRGDVNRADIWTEDDSQPRQRVAVLEDLILLIINLVTDTSRIMGLSQDQMVRIHLVHLLALNNQTYAELSKKLPEKYLERTILHVLDEVADLRQPTETSTGIYILRPELFSEVDPYWRHYSRNEHRAVQSRLEQEAKRVQPDKENPLLLPKPTSVPPEGEPFSNLLDLFRDDVIPNLVNYLLAHSLHVGTTDWPHECERPQLESLLDLALRLAMIALVVDQKHFSMASVEMIEGSNAMSTFQALWWMQATDSFEAFHPKVDHIMSIIVSNLPEIFTTEYRESRQQAAKPQPIPAKQSAAARQKALMAEFAKRQVAFAANLEDDEDIPDEDEEDDTVNYGQCIVCQEQVSSKLPGGMLALLQPSKILREVVNERNWLQESLLAPSGLDEASRYQRYMEDGEPEITEAYPSSSCRFGVHMSACGHMMHDYCMATYFDVTRLRHSAQVQRHHPENAMRQEYLCPLCKSIGNVLIPVETTRSPLLPIKQPSRVVNGTPATLSEKIRSVSEEGLIRVSDSARIWDFHIETGELAPWFTDCIFYHQTMDPENRKSMRNSAKMIDRFRALARALSEQSQRLRGKKSHMYLPEDIVSYTVACAEITQRGYSRGSGKTVAEQVPDTTVKLIKRLIGMLQLELDVYFGLKYDRSALRVGIFARFLPDWYRASTLPTPLLMRQPLSMVIETAALAPDLLHSVIVMSYYAELTRVMLGVSVFVRRSLTRTAPADRSSPPSDTNLADALGVFANFRSIMHAVLRSAGPFPDTEVILAHLSDEMLSKLLYSHTLPFLRRCAIIYYSIAGSYPLSEPTLILSKGCEYRRLLNLLAIPKPRETLNNSQSTESPIVSRWLSQWAVQGRVVPPLEYPGVYELFRLPRLLEEMVQRYHGMRCEVCQMKPSFPAVCMFCGKLVCLSGDCCAEGEQGECNIHMRDCGAAVGMFVDIRRWHILYLYAGSGSFGNMPYLDRHGELDIHMRRGHRQFIHLGRLDELRRAVWLQHAIPHLTARKLELTSDSGGWACL